MLISIKLKIILSLGLLICLSMGLQVRKVSRHDKVTSDKKQEAPTYKVTRLTQSMPIDANWDKKQWQDVEPIEITNYIAEIPPFRPKTTAKMVYDDENVYVIFKVEDSYVKSVVQEYNGNVSGDSCVEFFFSPDTNYPERYFNLEVNAGGTPLIFYIVQPWTDYTKLDAEAIDKIEIAHSMPKLIDPEITEPTTWTIEYRVPLSMLEQFSNVTRPEPGTIWKANFYKTASKSMNPHWVTWAEIDRKNFHMPQFFGTLEFQ